jgi:hypothetical protein
MLHGEVLTNRLRLASLCWPHNKLWLSKPVICYRHLKVPLCELGLHKTHFAKRRFLSRNLPSI